MKSFYSKISLVLVVVILSSTGAISQNKESLWTEISKEKTANKKQVFRKTQPHKATFYELNLSNLKTKLESAPDRKVVGKLSNVIIEFPLANGAFESFKVTEASIMAEELQNKYPNIRSYAGYSIENPATLIRFTVTPRGLHTMLLSPQYGTQFIDPYTEEEGNYIVYAKRDLPPLDTPWECGVISDDEDQDENMTSDYYSRNADDGMMRDFRTAVACTIEYSQFHWQAAGLNSGDSTADKKAAVLAAINVTMTRNNFLYERDFSITMTLVADQEDIIFIDSDNFTNNNANALIGESQTEIDNIIGFSNYDIGHTFSTGGGGLAALNSPCTSSKAEGITGSGSPVGDPYDVDYVAHEMGHQYGGPHTFNGDAGNCTGSNRSGSNAYEPGSGSTIMAYAGICSPQNVQSNSDPYFHQGSLQKIWANVSSGSSTCASKTATNNSAPTANAGNDYTIPKSTPYKLTGSSTDADGTTTHTFTWEQYDLGSAGPPDESESSAPIVRSFEGTTSPIRYIPRLQDIIAGGGVSTDWEKLSSISRDINFKLTVRDNDSRGGQTAVSSMKANTVSAAGPFVVTSQNTTGIILESGTTEEVTWDVAGTIGNGVDTANVNILLSTDGGLTYPTIVASAVPNNGSYTITVPAVESTTCRIMVEGAGNIFFNINTRDFEIKAPLSTTDYNTLSGLSIFPNPNNGSFTVKFNNLNSMVGIKVLDIRGRSIYNKSYTSTVTFNEDINLKGVQSGIYLLKITDGSKTVNKKIVLE